EEPWRTRCWETMAQGGREVAAFIGVSRWYGEVMCDRLKIDPAKMHVIPIGVEAGDPPTGATPNPPAVGYLARMADLMGLRTLVEAWIKLKKTEKFKSLRLHLSGGKTADDGPYLERLEKQLSEAGGRNDGTFFCDLLPKSRA